jgi:type VI secretion system secreted protein VgrG
MRSFVPSFVVAVVLGSAALFPSRSHAQYYSYSYYPQPSYPAQYSSSQRSYSTQSYTPSYDNAHRWLQSSTVQQGFPNLGSDYVVLGPRSRQYNCAAYSVGNTSSWIWPGYSIYDFDNLYRQYGYYRAAYMDLRHFRNQDKVAVYGNTSADGGVRVTHAARQARGGWASKMGAGPLIWHRSVYSLSGPSYGTPVAVYVRLR